MAPDQLEEGSWEFHRLTPERWADFEELFGERGATGGCWCMWWRLTGREFDAQKGEGNRRAWHARPLRLPRPGLHVPKRRVQRGRPPLGNEADHALCGGL